MYAHPCLRLALLLVPTERAAEEKRLSEAGIPGDVDFQRMIARFREERGTAQLPHVKPGDLKICICVRKRPINEKEKKRKDYDAVTCLNPVVSGKRGTAIALAVGSPGLISLRLSLPDVVFQR